MMKILDYLAEAIVFALFIMFYLFPKSIYDKIKSIWKN